MRREWTIWLGFAVAVLIAAVFVVSRDDGTDDRAQLSAGTTLPSTVAPSTTVTSFPPTSTTSSSTTVPPTTVAPTTAPATTTRSSPATTEGTVAEPTPPTAAPTVPTTAAPLPQVVFGPGTYRIGIDLPAGTYRTDGGRNCFWARLSSLSGTPESIIDEQSTNGSPTTVTVDPADAAFTTTGCAIWQSA